MHILIALLWQVGLSIAASLVMRVVTALGIGVVAYTGMSVTLGWLKDRAVSAALGLPADVLGMLATMKLGESLSIVSSAILARLIINGLTSDTVKRWAIK